MTLEERRQKAEQAARARLAAHREGLERLVAEPPSAGDLLWLPAGAAWPVEWLVVEAGAAGLTLVPADTHPGAGAADVILDGDPGPLTLRCGFATGLPTGKLGAFRRTGRIPAQGLETVRRRLVAAADGDAGDGYEGDPDLRDWIADVVLPAKQALVPAATSRYAAPQKIRRGERRYRWLELAASAVLAAGLALAGGQIWSEGKIRRIEEQKAREAERLESRIADLSRRAAAGEKAGREAEASRRRLASAEVLTAPPRPPLPAAVEPLLNPRIEWFQPASDALRGEERRVLVPDGAERVFFVLETWSPRPYARYRVQLLGAAGAPPLWQADGLVVQGSSEIVFGLPANRLPAQARAFQLFGLEKGKPVALERFDFRVKKAE